jgi:hypothetical protein
MPTRCNSWKQFSVHFSGYTAPEYAIRGELTVKADTYSFGVLVLEIISSRKNTDLSLPNEMQYLPEHVSCFLNPILGNETGICICLLS